MTLMILTSLAILTELPEFVLGHIYLILIKLVYYKNNNNKTNYSEFCGRWNKKPAIFPLN